MKMGTDIYNTDAKIERLRARMSSHPEILDSNKEHILRFFDHLSTIGIRSAASVQSA